MARIHRLMPETVFAKAFGAQRALRAATEETVSRRPSVTAIVITSAGGATLLCR